MGGKKYLPPEALWLRTLCAFKTKMAARKEQSVIKSDLTNLSRFTLNFSVHMLGCQLLGIVITLVLVVVGGLVIGLAVKTLFKGSLRVSEEAEARGLDVASHGESAYPAYSGLD